MLARNFKSAEDLCITDKERSALIQVLGMLERGELKHVDLSDINEFEGSGFNMGDFTAKADPCGTVCCIAGWADRLFDTSMSEGWYSSPELDDLFLTPFGPGVMNRITVAEAAQALSNYLTTGAAKWRQVHK